MNKAAYYTGKGGRVTGRAGAGTCGAVFRGHWSYLPETGKPQSDSRILLFQTQSFSALLAAEMKLGCSYPYTSSCQPCPLLQPPVLSQIPSEL